MSVKKIVVEVAGRMIELEYDQAVELYKDLKELFGKDEEPPAFPPVYPSPPLMPMPLWQPTWCKSDTTTGTDQTIS